MELLRKGYSSSQASAATERSCGEGLTGKYELPME
jgi:hypothetical protein